MDNNITMVKGDTGSFGVWFKDAPDIEIDQAFLSAKVNYESEEYVFQKSLGHGISKIDKGKYTVRIAPSDTESLPVGDYYYDFKIKIHDDVFTLLRGLLILLNSVTKEV